VVADPFTAARALLIARWLADRITTARRDNLEPAALTALPVGTRIPVELGGLQAGTVSRPRPPVRAVIKDQAAFTQWAVREHPGEVELVPVVRQSFTDAVKRQVRDHGGLLDKTTGEITPVPGMERAEGDPVVRVELGDGADAAVQLAWGDGDIWLGDVLALPPGGGQE
jgi:hypothetical protein